MKIRCDRCNREIREFWGVLGFPGKTFGRQCALQVCQGNEKMLKKKVVEISLDDLDFEIPY